MAYASTCGLGCPTTSNFGTASQTSSVSSSSTPALLSSSSLLTSSDLLKLKTYFNGTNFNLTRIYQVNNGRCDFLAWQAALNQTTSVLTVAKSSSGFVFGGYRSISCTGRNAGQSYADSQAFIFSLTGSQVFYTKSPSQKSVWCDSLYTSKPNYMEGWVSALHFYAESNSDS